MYFSNIEEEQLAILEIECPLCNNVSRISIVKHTRFHCLFPFLFLWETNGIIGTCGNCHNSFKIDYDQYPLLESMGIEIQESNFNKNITSLFIVFLVVAFIFMMMNITNPT